MASPNLDNNVLVFTIGRMNPPTPGHILLIEKLIQRAASMGQNKIGIILSHSQDIPKNPLYCNEKRKILLSGMIQSLKEKMKNKTYLPAITPENIDRVEPIIICMDDETPEEFGKHPIIKSLTLLLTNYGYPENRIERAVLIIGEDRAKSYGWVQKNLEERDPPIMVDVEALPRPEGAISATEIRGYAMSGDWPNFLLKMQSTGSSEATLRELYDQLHELLTAAAPVAKRGKTRGGTRRRLGKRGCNKTKKRKNKTKKNKKIYRQSK
jgi:hypothetical protein